MSKIAKTDVDQRIKSMMSNMNKINEDELIKHSISNTNLMTFIEFINYNTIDMNNFYVNTFIDNLKNNIPILLNESLINDFGFKGDLKQQKHNINKLLENNFKFCENESYWIYTNDEYSQFRTDLLLESKQINSKTDDIESPLNIAIKLLLSFQNINNKLNILFPEEHVEYNKPEILWGKFAPQDLFKVYPEIIIKHGTSSTKQILIMPDLYIDMLMKANTDTGRLIRQQYIQTKKVFMYYNLYQIEFKNIELSNKALKLANDRFEEHHNEQIKLLKDEQSKSNDERLKAEKFRLTSEKQHNKLINKIDEQSAQIDKLLGFAESTDNRLKIIAPNHVEITRLTYDQCYKCVILKHTKETDIMPYYVIRSQVKSIDEAIKTQQIKYSNRLIVIHTSDQPNPIAFFNIIKSELKDNIKINKNWFSLNDMTDIEFKNKLIDINSRRTKTI
jgi:hypothetical protein